ncbi:unnamed protein product [Didymodactylos carnosus]|uniref:Uncharacterized protein n=1 Tax=Didymodactylos carnosus TaxID=1234261 RepID=A0A815F354_9BILA|nr:unnamed protein product [Didymodactylos carnosus]CAF4166046.1 unnamed protein product [Didymodactylos carnosus]
MVSVLFCIAAVLLLLACLAGRKWNLKLKPVSVVHKFAFIIHIDIVTSEIIKKVQDRGTVSTRSAITKLDVRSGWSSCQICNQCGNLIHDMKLELCKECDCDNLLEFYYYSLAEQLQHILLIRTMYDQMTKQREQNEEKLRVTTYADILMDESDTSFTMTINADGIVSKNQHVALWPVMFMLNEIPLPTRRYSESIVLVGVIPAKKHPSNKSFETILNIVSEQCKQLESGISYFIPGHGEKRLKVFLIAACSDKPAQSLLQNTVAYNANYGCARCFI